MSLVGVEAVQRGGVAGRGAFETEVDNVSGGWVVEGAPGQGAGASDVAYESLLA